MSAADLSKPASVRPRDRKAQIETNATELFAVRGFHSVRMDDIASATGITARALYRHYENKQALLRSVVFGNHRRLVETLARFEPIGSDPDAVLDALELLALASLQSSLLSVLWQRESRHLNAEDLAEFQARGQLVVENFARVFAHEMPVAADSLTREIRSWAALSLLTSPGRNDALNLPRRSLTRLLANATLGILRAPLADGELRDSAIGHKAFEPVARRERLIAGAAEILRNTGYAGVGIDEIGASAGVAGPAIYRYFESKSDILVEVVTRFYEWIAHEDSRALAAGGEPETVLKALLAGYVRVTLEATDLMAVTTNESLNLPTETAERIRRIHADGITEWSRWIRTVRPDISEQLAQVNIQAAQTVINNVALLSRFREHPRLVDELESAGSAALFATW